LNKQLLKIGKFIKPHGIKGLIKFFYYGDLDNFDYKEVFLENEGKLLSYFIEQWRHFKDNILLLKIKGIDTIEDIDTFLKGRDVFVNRENITPLEDGEYYWFELIGSKVYDMDKNYIGELTQIIETGSNDVFIVKDKDKEILIPYIEDVVKEIDIANSQIFVSMLEAV